MFAFINLLCNYLRCICVRRVSTGTATTPTEGPAPGADVDQASSKELYIFAQVCEEF